MKNKDWKKVEQLLEFVNLGHAKLKVDNYIVDLYLKQMSLFKNCIVFYINSEFKGEWLVKDCEERKRFCCCKTKTILTPKDIKALGLKRKKEIQEYKEKYSYNEYLNYWTNFEALKKHFEKNNINIEILEA